MEYRVTDPKPTEKTAYQTPVLVRVGSFEEVTRQLSVVDLLGGALVYQPGDFVDWSHGRVS